MEPMRSPRRNRPASTFFLTLVTTGVLCAWLSVPGQGTEPADNGRSTGPVPVLEGDGAVTGPGARDPDAYGGGKSSGDLQREYGCERGYVPAEHC
ncbi:hypothetical protein N599_15620 [Saccharopolyspora erythraea D]|nr:hypothetical protein N599_15620 [Saccharopolyspora erythraea D]